MREKSVHDKHRRELVEKWRQWSKVVELFATQKEGRFRINAEKYAALHKELTALCSTQSESLDPDLMNECREVLAPWRSLESLVWTERSVLFDLLRRSIEIECRLEGKRARFSRSSSMIWLLSAATAVGIGVGVLWSSARIPMVLPGQEPQEWLREFERFIVSLSPEYLILVGVGVALIGGAMAWRMARGP